MHAVPQNHTHKCADARDTHTSHRHVYTHTHARAHTCLHTCTHMHKQHRYTYTPVHDTHMHTHTVYTYNTCAAHMNCTHTYAHAHTHTCAQHTHIHINACMHVYGTHMNTHTYSLCPQLSPGPHSVPTPCLPPSGGSHVALSGCSCLYASIPFLPKLRHACLSGAAARGRGRWGQSHLEGQPHGVSEAIHTKGLILKNTITNKPRFRQMLPRGASGALTRPPLEVP